MGMQCTYAPNIVSNNHKTNKKKRNKDKLYSKSALSARPGPTSYRHVPFEARWQQYGIIAYKSTTESNMHQYNLPHTKIAVKWLRDHETTEHIVQQNMSLMSLSFQRFLFSLVQNQKTTGTVSDSVSTKLSIGHGRHVRGCKNSCHLFVTSTTQHGCPQSLTLPLACWG